MKQVNLLVWLRTHSEEYAPVMRLLGEEVTKTVVAFDHLDRESGNVNVSNN